VTETTPTTVRETERKYESAEPVDAALAAALGAAAAGVPADGVPVPAEPVEHALAATYFDTEDLRLLRSKITLRRRSGGSDDGWHLKLPAGPDSREEIRLPLDPSRTPPAPLVALTRAAHRGAALQPVVELATVRREWTLTDAAGHALATVTDDRVTGQTLGAETGATSWAEIEVELAEHGTAEVLERVDAALLAAGAQRSAAASKLGRVLADRMPPGPPRPVAGPDATAGEVVLAYLWEQAEAIRAADPLVRQEAPDSVHAMRVGSRRMRSALQSFRALLDRDATAGVVAELRWLAGQLGGARDTEVQEQRIGAAVAALPPELAMGPVAAEVTRFFARRRTDASRTATEALDSDRYLALLDALDALLADPPLTPAAADPAVDVLPGLVRRAVKRADRELKAADARPPGPERDEHLHEMRKAAKRLRYAAEAATPALGKAAERLVKQVKKVQELLGEHQDSVVARGLLRELAAGAAAEGGNGFAFGWLMRDEHARAERVEEQLDKAWATLRRRARAVTG
jgi:CHAD domain-containing protein